jgi:hypothetical protein
MYFNRKGGWTKSYSSGYRSGLEEKNAKYLEQAGVDVAYEEHEIIYTIPESTHKYTPDIVLPNGIIVETKGIFSVDDRKKHQLIKKQYPNLDIRFVFTNPNTKINKGSPTSYAKWCEKQGFLYAKGLIPATWIQEGKKDTTGLTKKKGK